MPANPDNRENLLNEPPSACFQTTDSEIDLSLLKDSLAKTPWELMLANDDALNFADSLRNAMKEYNRNKIDSSCPS